MFVVEDIPGMAVLTRARYHAPPFWADIAPSISYELPAALFAIVKAQRIILRDKNTGALFPGSIAIYNVP